VSLRDASVEVTADIDPRPLLARLQAGSEANAAAPPVLEEAELRALFARAEEVLESETRLSADGQRIGLIVHVPLDPSEMRALLQASPETRHERAHLIPVRWEAKEPLVSAKQIEVMFPAVLGPVLITFVQPSTRLTPPFASATFSVLEKPPSDAPKRRGWAEGAALLAVVAILLNLWIYRRKRFLAAPVSDPS